ncbi:M24 family metallopeptidase [Clostridium sp. MT-14]|uniref:M24 family metallopeptidase n=1 Tax=Clostridium sp. MT-14 TaxID=3348360 RepID=UPI0035F30B16
MKCTPKSEVYTRISNFQRELQDKNIDGAIVLLNSDMFYFTGTVQKSFLYMPCDGEPILMVKRSMRRALDESPLKNIVPIKSPRQIPQVLSDFGYDSIKKIGLELDVLPFNIYTTYKNMFPDAKFYDVSPLIRGIRAVKSLYEIQLLQNAVSIIGESFLQVPSFLREGMSEMELAALFEAEMRKRGYSGFCRTRAFNQEFFYGNVCTGESGFYPSFFDGPVGGSGPSVSHSQGAGWKRVNKNEVVYIDYTCVIEGYAGDQTRVFCMGQLTPKMVKAFDDAVLIESEVAKSIKPGTLAEEPYFLALKMAEEMGYKDNFMGYKEDRVKFLGHGIGLELDEWPVLAKGFKSPIMPGMTFAMEPKFVFPEGCIGTENSFVMTETGLKNMATIPEVITYLDK